MIFDAVKRAHEILAANFAADLNALITAKSLTGAVSATTVFDRLGSDSFAADVTFTTAGLGVYWGGQAQTQARHQDLRESVVWVEAEYYARGDDPAVLAKQAELAAEAVLRSVDRMGGDGSVLGAAEQRNSVTIQGPRLAYLKDGEKSYEDQVIVRFPMIDEDQGLAT